jgi:hypothetical protein
MGGGHGETGTGLKIFIPAAKPRIIRLFYSIFRRSFLRLAR